MDGASTQKQVLDLYHFQNLAYLGIFFINNITTWSARQDDEKSLKRKKGSKLNHIKLITCRAMVWRYARYLPKRRQEKVNFYDYSHCGAIPSMEREHLNLVALPRRRGRGRLRN